jgi:hypothetical protein
MKFTISQKRAEEFLGKKLSLDDFVEGKDYKVIKCFKSQRVAFREDFLPEVLVSSVEQPQQVEQVAQASGSGVFKCKVMRIYPNSRYIETDTQGKIFAGGKGASLRRGQVIKVKDCQLYLGRE